MNLSRTRRLAWLAVAVAVLSAPLLLRAAGVLLPGTQPSDGSGDPAFPPFRNQLGAPGTLLRPGACDNCHAGYRQPGQAPYEAFDTWAGSMMSQAARDPLFWAALDVANQDDADRLGNQGIGDLCLRCHVPKAWYEGRSTCLTSWGQSFDGACLQGPATAPDNDFEGLSCHFCHRMVDASTPPTGDFLDPLAPYSGNAQVYLATDHLTHLGPFTDADTGSHPARGDAFFRSSALCGQCHDVTNPLRNRRDVATGADLGYPMPIERTWTEYRQSRIADITAPEHSTCQGCHMPGADHDDNGTIDDAYACMQQTVVRGVATANQGPIRKHEFAGGNSWMLGVLRDEIGDALGRRDELDAGVEATRRLLARAVQMEVAAPPSVVAGEALAVSVRATNLSGHKFPTGYPEGRRAWLRVLSGEDLDSDGVLAPAEIEHESGAWDPATGTLVVDPQLMVYEAKLGVWDFNGTGLCDLVDQASGREMFHFVLNDCVVKDSRIPPLGFVPDGQTAPVAHAYPPDPALPGALANWDDAPFAFPTRDDVTRNIVVEAWMRYQTTSREYVEFLRESSRLTRDPSEPGCDPTQPDLRANRGEKMHDLWTRHGRAAPEEIAVARAVVAVTPAPPRACCRLGACVELEPAACRAVEGDPAGPGTTCALPNCAPVGLLPGEAADAEGGAAPLLVVSRDAGTGRLDVTFAPACDATDHVMVSGAITSVAAQAHDAIACGLGGTGAASFDPGAGSRYFLVVGQTPVAEGSLGRDSFGVERPERVGSAPCDAPQILGATCQ